MNYRLGRAIQLIAAPLVVAILNAGCASLPAANSQVDFHSESGQIAHRLQEVFAAATSKDFKRLDSYHSYGPKFTKFSGSSPERLDANAGRQGEHDGLGAISGLKMRAEALKIDVFGDVGIATFILDYQFDGGGGIKHARERTTMVFVREKGDWKIVHEHLSPIKP